MGKSYMCYWCGDCDAYVGCHRNTRKALGTMANQELRKLRIKAHNCFDHLWKSGLQSRDEVYRLLKQITGKKVHIGESDKETCIKIINYFNSKVEL